MGAVFVKTVTYYDIRMIRLILEALLSRMGKRRRSPDIERDREIQTREDKLGFCEKRRSAEKAIKYYNKKHKGAKFKLVEIISACSFFSMGIWEHINFTASEDDKCLIFFLLNCHMEKLIGEGIIKQKLKKSLHALCWKKVNYAFLLFLLMRTLDSLVIFIHFVEELPSRNMMKTIMHPYPFSKQRIALLIVCHVAIVSFCHMFYPGKFIIKDPDAYFIKSSQCDWLICMFE
ncbi:uncharacterized protein [Populus alba]|uniref:uncharacterized protein isoform X2 n=1 Tax=Populus alba TaxID=43335 RepID=UPI003CC77911